MGCMLRSDHMTQLAMFLQPDSAFMVVSRLGEAACVQFADLNEFVNAFQRTYVMEICRCAEMERKLRYIVEKMQDDNIYIPVLTDNPEALELHEFNTYEAVIEKWERIIVEMTANLTNMNKTHLGLSEMSFMLTCVSPMLGNADLHTANLGTIKEAVEGRKLPDHHQLPVHHHHAHDEDGARLTVITGLVQRRRSYYLRLMVWRISKGNAYYKQAEEDEIFKDSMTNADVRKVAFLLVVQGEELGTRMRKVCEGFRCDLYPLPATIEERENTHVTIDLRIHDLDTVMDQSKFHRCKAMRSMAKSYHTYLLKIRKAKAIYHILNFFTLDITKNCLIGRCWIPTADLDSVQKILDDCTEKMETSVPCFMSTVSSHDVPPTYHRTNKFTHAFQALISAYGDSTYRELNPGLYTIITFPFLFSMMFGDMGHGSMMLAGAIWMLVNEKKFMASRNNSEIWNILFGGRYIILLMSLFSIYAGLIYNDCFSKSFTLFNTGWKCNKTLEELGEEKEFLLELPDHSHPYIIGKDPLWEHSRNKILFENSLKMKLSIIFGVTHMIFGLMISFFNDVYFKKYKYLAFLEFFPQIIFLLSIFFWLVILIFFKWFKYGGSQPASEKVGQTCAPLVLIIFIDMMLMSTTEKIAEECDAYMFDGQKTVQTALLAIGVIQIPIMLFGPPCYAARVASKKKRSLLKRMPNESENPEAYALWKDEMHHIKTFGDLMIHQAVKTIEYVLSTISHTASYLRLWALSLAHAQLSEMLWEMIFVKMALHDHSMMGGFKIVVVFAIWAGFTTAILVVMEGLSAFLHTLRLHWVEFMSKFYIGKGVMFKPFSFDALFSDAKEKTEVCPATKLYEY